MNEEERLMLNNYIEDLYQAMQIGNIVFEPKHSNELYNLINKLLQENKNLKEQLQIKEDIINKAIKFVKDYKTEWTLNDEVLNDMNKLLEILDNKGE